MVELIIDNSVLSLSRREVDVALRPVRPKQGDLWGRKLADVAWTLYGTFEYFKASGNPIVGPGDIGRHTLIGWEETTAGIKAADWLNRAAPLDAFVYRTNSLVNQFTAARAGIGLALLPCYLGDSTLDLTRALPDPLPDLVGELWIVTHADLKRTARVRAFFDVVGEGLARERELFEGRRNSGA